MRVGQMAGLLAKPVPAAESVPVVTAPALFFRPYIFNSVSDALRLRILA
jgi:hypothetical protein